jgi:hypothetical protein
MKYDRNPRYLHPFIALKLEDILDAIQAKLPEGYTCKMISAQRTPEDQFKLFKKGRAFQNGNLGYCRPQQSGNAQGRLLQPLAAQLPAVYRHRYRHFPQQRVPKQTGPLPGCGRSEKLGLDWGGDWTSFRDTPHLEIPKRIFFENDINKDNGYIWQQYLKKAGTYKGVLDGIFGPKSIAALKAATGESTRNMAAWDKLYEGHGVITV